MAPHCQAFIQALREKGYRLTPQREMVIEALAHSGKHVTAEEVLGYIRERTRSVNIATVYRTLDLLVSEGLATRMALGDGRSVYATTQHGPHIHLLCRKCGRVIEADEQLLASFGQRAQAQYGFAAELRHLSIPGLCRDCQLGQSSPELADESQEGGYDAHS